MRRSLRYHHVGIPTRERRAGEAHLEAYGLYASGYEDSPYGVEWMRFEDGCPLPDLVKTVPHVAFVVEDLEAAIAGKEILIPPNSPSEGVRVAFIVDNGAPIEFLEFDGPAEETGRKRASRTGRPPRARGARRASRARRPGR